jgi:nitroreductase
METWDAITSRRNVRQFADRPLDEPVLDRILEAGRRAPSSRNWQPWDFVVVTDSEQLRELSTVGPGAFHAANAAAAVALVIEDYDDPTVRERARYDVGQATMAMMIAAADQGVGSGHIGVQDQDKAREVLGLPADRRVAYLLDFGYPADRPLAPIRNPDRRSFDEVVHRGRW